MSGLLRALRAAMREHNVFRGRIISLHQSGREGSVGVQFHVVPPVERDGVSLPEGTLERLERHSIGVAENADWLRSAGKHLKRGVLLHGPPGTGKTLSVMYLLHAMPGRTTILLTGRGLGLIEQALAIGRDLAPATFVFEDIDLVAAEVVRPPAPDDWQLAVSTWASAAAVALLPEPQPAMTTASAPRATTRRKWRIRALFIRCRSMTAPLARSRT